MYQGTDVVKSLEMEDCWGLSEPNIILEEPNIILEEKQGGRKVRERVKMPEARGQRKRLEDASLLAFQGGKRQEPPDAGESKAVDCALEHGEGMQPYSQPDVGFLKQRPLRQSVCVL